MTLHPIKDLQIMLPLHVVPMLRDEGIITLDEALDQAAKEAAT